MSVYGWNVSVWREPNSKAFFAEIMGKRWRTATPRREPFRGFRYLAEDGSRQNALPARKPVDVDFMPNPKLQLVPVDQSTPRAPAGGTIDRATWTSRTLIGTVLIADIVGYSKQSVQRQQGLKETFNAALGEALKVIAWSDTVTMDTGDGAAVAFLGGAEEAVLAALLLLHEMSNRDEAGLLRVGVHLGPCKVRRGVSGAIQVVGDGVNDAEEIMAFAAPGQLTISRAYFDMLSNIGDDYSALFVVQAPRTGKNGMRRECHYLHDARHGDALQNANRLFDRVLNQAQSATPPTPLAAESKAGARAVLKGAKLAIVRCAARPARISMAAGALLLLSASAGWLAISKNDPAQARPVGMPASGQSAAARRTSEPPASSPIAAPLPKRGKVQLAIHPWGEVHVDGTLRGISPPLKTLNLDPGKYRIEVRNGDLTPHRLVVVVPSGGTIVIKHGFTGQPGKP